MPQLGPHLAPILTDTAPPLGIARLEDWPTTLADMVLAAVDEPFAWGTHDCCMWTADVVLAMSADGIDLAAPYRGTYSDAAGAADVISGATGGGTLEDLMVQIAAEYTLPEVAPVLARRGDVALFDTPLPEPPDPIIPPEPTPLPPDPTEPPDPAPDQRRRRRARDATSGPAMGIVGPDALTAAFVSPDGLVMVDMANVRRCWRIEAGTETIANAIPNDSASGAIAGTPGTPPTNWTVAAPSGITTEIGEPGNDLGIPYFELHAYGTAAADGHVTVGFHAPGLPIADGQTWNLACSVRMVAGSLDGLADQLRVDWDEYTAPGGTYLTSVFSDPAVAPTDAWQVVENWAPVAGGPTSTSAEIYLFYSVAGGSPVDLTLRIGKPTFQQIGG